MPVSQPPNSSGPRSPASSEPSWQRHASDSTACGKPPSVLHGKRHNRRSTSMARNDDSLDSMLRKISPQKGAEPSPGEDDPDTLSISQMDGRYSRMRPANKN